MNVNNFIARMRREYHDLPVKHNDVKIANGSATIFKTMYAPILESSYAVYVNNALQEETTNYSLDKDTGDIIFQSAPTNGQEVKVIYQSVNWRDQNWLEAIQSAFYGFGDQFFKTVLRESIQTLQGASMISCPSGCIRTTEFLVSDNNGPSGNFILPWNNLRYDRSSNKLLLGSKFTTNGYGILSYLRRLTVPSGGASVMDVDDNWLELLKLKCGSLYLRSMANKVSQQGNASTEEGFFSVNQLRGLANDDEAKYENLKIKLKPVMPAQTIPFNIPGLGAV